LVAPTVVAVLATQRGMLCGGHRRCKGRARWVSNVRRFDIVASFLDCRYSLVCRRTYSFCKMDLVCGKARTRVSETQNSL